MEGEAWRREWKEVATEGARGSNSILDFPKPEQLIDRPIAWLAPPPPPPTALFDLLELQFLTILNHIFLFLWSQDPTLIFLPNLFPNTHTV